MNNVYDTTVSYSKRDAEVTYFMYALTNARIFAEAQFITDTYYVYFDVNGVAVNNPWHNTSEICKYYKRSAYERYDESSMDKFITDANNAMQKVIEFAYAQFEDGSNDNDVYFIHGDMHINCPWYDVSGRVELSMEESFRTYTKEKVLGFIIDVYKRIMLKE